MKIGFVGGDLRQMTTLSCFKEEGHFVKIYGYDGLEESVSSFDELKDCDIIVFPLPTCNGDYIFAPMCGRKIHINEIDLSGCKQIFYAGGNEQFNEKIINSGALCINYLSDEELVQKNAIATAEGAVDIVINETAHTIFSSKILITGFGRVAKAVAKLLKGFGAEVTIAARRREALAEAYCEGYNTEFISNLGKVVFEYSVIINTVPAMVINDAILEKVSDDSLIIDLASKPGGVDFEAAKKLNKRVIWALSLPGKVAPITSGKIIYNTMVSILEERAVMWGEAE